MGYLLDTNILSELRKGNSCIYDSGGISDRLAQFC
jgi:predicted nucleic acid-binding protein